MSLANILIVEDDFKLREALTEVIASRGYEVFAASSLEEALKIMATFEVNIVISDINLGDIKDGFEVLKHVKKGNTNIPVILITAYGDIKRSVEAMKLGASDYVLKPFEPKKVLSLLEKYLPKSLKKQSNFVAVDKSMQSVLSLVEKIADTTVSVLLIGESGTGKEVIAKRIHNLSSRVNQPFVAVNCAAIPETMLEAILFGYEKGSFTGAIKTTKGKFEQAQFGTIFLDEVSEMPMNLQAKFLRVIQEREVERLGGKDGIDLDIRVISASNKELYREVQKGNFREDLYYRLNVFPVKLPKLKDRVDDIIPLAKKFIEVYSSQYKKQVVDLTNSAAKALLSYSWPGNVRELENIIQRAVILSEKDKIGTKEIILENEEQTKDLGCSVQSVEQKIILKALEENNGKRIDTAKQLGISSRTLRYKLAQMKDKGIEIPESIK